ncbi:MAG: ATP-binding cassette domain-containing protein [Thaumarchaeota archaeon]|nr:ATP-binding cassette domain-containing protein [Nitrososphaerota archaeon]
MNSIVEAIDLTKKFGEKTAVDHVSFEVGEGELFGFLGPNGAGKTTTIRMLTTLASISEGRALIAGLDVAKNPGGVRAKIGVVPQQLIADDELKGIENVLLFGKLHHVPADKARRKAAELLQLVDLQDSAEKKAKTYSGGMKRRLQLVMGLIHEPRVLFLDEPSLGLDIQTRSKMWEYLQKLNDEHGVTIFMTTHYLEEADMLCDRVAIIDHGVIKVSGSPSELKTMLGGELLSIQVSEGPDVTRFLEGTLGVSEVRKLNNFAYQIKIPRVEIALPQIVDGLTVRKLKITDISFSKPTLDQVFLQVTGRKLRDGESETEAPLVVPVLTEKVY